MQSISIYICVCIWCTCQLSLLKEKRIPFVDSHWRGHKVPPASPLHYCLDLCWRNLAVSIECSSNGTSSAAFPLEVTRSDWPSPWKIHQVRCSLITYQLDVLSPKPMHMLNEVTFKHVRISESLSLVYMCLHDVHSGASSQGSSLITSIPHLLILIPSILCLILFLFAFHVRVWGLTWGRVLALWCLFLTS